GVTVNSCVSKPVQVNLEGVVKTRLPAASIAEAVRVTVLPGAFPKITVGSAGRTTTWVMVLPMVRLTEVFCPETMVMVVAPVACAVPVPSALGKAVAETVRSPVGSGSKVAVVLPPQIGRASCRERVWTWEWERSSKREDGRSE